MQPNKILLLVFVYFAYYQELLNLRLSRGQPKSDQPPNFQTAVISFVMPTAVETSWFQFVILVGVVALIIIVILVRFYFLLALSANMTKTVKRSSPRRRRPNSKTPPEWIQLLRNSDNRTQFRFSLSVIL